MLISHRSTNFGRSFSSIWNRVGSITICSWAGYN